MSQFKNEIHVYKVNEVSDKEYNFIFSDKSEDSFHICLSEPEAKRKVKLLVNKLQRKR